MKKNAWEVVQIVRDMNRPTALDYVKNIFDDFLFLLIIEMGSMAEYNEGRKKFNENAIEM